MQQISLNALHNCKPCFRKCWPRASRPFVLPWLFCGSTASLELRKSNPCGAGQGVFSTSIANVVHWAMDWHPGVETLLCLVCVTDSCTLARGINGSGLLSHQLMPLGGEISAVHGQGWSRSLFWTAGKVWPSVEPS